MDVNEIKALISPNRPGGVSALELEKASRLIDELDDLARQTVTGCVDIARRERARAEAAEAEAARLGEALNLIDAARAKAITELAELRELYTDRENDLLHEATGRRTAEDSLDEVRQALGVYAPVSVVDEAKRLREQVAALKAFVAVVRYQVDADIPPSLRRQTLREELSKIDAANSSQDAA